jgi:hypothetical protein
LRVKRPRRALLSKRGSRSRAFEPREAGHRSGSAPRRRAPLGRDLDLVVDGGIGLDTVVDAATHGANAFVMGSAFFRSGDYKRFADEIRARLAPYDPAGAAQS